MNIGRVEGAFSLKTKLIHLVFSGSDFGSKWRELCGFIYPATEHLKCLGDILVSAAMADCILLAVNSLRAVLLKRQCLSTFVGGACG